MYSRLLRRLPWLGLPFLASACVLLIQRGPEARDLPASTSTRAPVKAHLLDGSVVVFPEGAAHESDRITGEGRHYGLDLTLLGQRESVPLDSVAGVEAISYGTDPTASVVASVITTPLAVLGGAALHAAIFGSCPTVYASPDPDAPMEAELFSHSIVPLAEARDVDRLGLSGRHDRVVLDIRNEALETHFINHLELLEVTHDEGEVVVPDSRGLPVAAAGWLETLAVRDRDGRDVTALVASGDSLHFSTSRERLAAAGVEDFEDHLVLEVTAPDADSAVVIFRMRNSLLNTVLLYDFMLGQSGLHAVDWLRGTLERLGTAVETGRWYRSRMGLRVEVWDDHAFRPVGRVADSGPLAWKDVALTIPVPEGGARLRIRLSFLADQWRIDRIRVAGRFRRPAVRVVPLARITDASGMDLPGARDAAGRPDARYLETRPGDVVQGHFEVGPASGSRTFLLAAQGYYTEWIRPEWIRAATPPRPFVPSDSVLMLALDRWRTVQYEMESKFFQARIPTR